MYHANSFCKQLKLYIRAGLTSSAALERCYGLARDDWEKNVRPYSRSETPRMPFWLDPPQTREKSETKAKVKRVNKTARKLFKGFTGHDSINDVVLEIPDAPTELVSIGELTGLIYVTKRDGKIEKYIHQFSRQARPLLCLTPDGRTAHMIGGLYEFNETGFTDGK